MCEGGSPDYEIRSDEAAILSVSLTQRRRTTPAKKYAFKTAREAAIVEAAVDVFIRRILEAECPTPDE